MADYMGIKISGATELKKVIDQLPQVLADKVYMQALRKGTVFVRDEIKLRAPVESSMNSSKNHLSYKKNRTEFITIKNELRVKVITKTKLTYELAITRGRAFWAIFYEFGTAHRSTEKGAGRGAMTAHPFIRPSWDASRNKALDIVGKELGAGVEKQAGKLAGPLAKSGLLRK